MPSPAQNPAPATPDPDESLVNRSFVLEGGETDDAPSPNSADTEASKTEMVLSMGPQHPSTHGVLRLELVTDGEIVRRATTHIGYLHRCKEKIGESLPYVQYIGYTDRLDYLSAMNNNHAWSMAVEKLAGIDVPPRAEFIRVIAAELNRIASHLISFGTYGMDMGAFTPFWYALREREFILDLFEQLCGARLTLSYINIGGVTWDLPPMFLEKVAEFLDYFEPKLPEYRRLLTDNQIFRKRTVGVAPISKRQAIDFALTGPVLRACGVKADLRRDAPYSVYDRFDFEVITAGTGGESGDCFDRYVVRMDEMAQSCRILRQAIGMVPDGSFRARLPRLFKVPPGEVYLESENPRGRLGFLVISQGGPVPYRVKIRGPSFCNLSIISHLCKGLMLADIPAVIGSIDVVMGEVDR